LKGSILERPYFEQCKAAYERGVSGPVFKKSIRLEHADVPLGRLNFRLLCWMRCCDI
jgi:hypothetical protein